MYLEKLIIILRKTYFLNASSLLVCCISRLQIGFSFNIVLFVAEVNITFKTISLAVHIMPEQMHSIGWTCDCKNATTELTYNNNNNNIHSHKFLTQAKLMGWEGI